MRRSMQQKFSFRRRAPAGDDDDLLSLQSADKEPLNPLLHSSTPKTFQRLTTSLKRTRSTPMKPNPNSVGNKTPLTPDSNNTNNGRPRNGNNGTSSSNNNNTNSSGPAKTKVLSTSRKSSNASINSKTTRRSTPRASSSSSLLSPSSQEDFNRIVQAAQALDNAGNDLFAKGKFDDALASYTRALKLKRRTLKFGVAPETDNAQQLLASVATSINNIGYLRQRSGGKTDEIMAAYQDSLQIKKEILGDTDLSVGKTLNNIGSVYFGSRAYADALTAYAEAKLIMEHNLGPQHLDVATVYSNIGDVHLAQRHLVEARESYAASLSIRWSELGDHHPKVVRLLEKIAAIEMSDTPQKIEQIQILDDEEEKAETPVQTDLRVLREQVKEDVTYVDNVKRQMALEMIRDKIQLIREMRELNGNTLHDEEHASALTPHERNKAISAVKERVERLKERKSRESDERSRDCASTDSGSSQVERSMAQLNLDAKFEATEIEVDEAAAKFMF